MIHWSQGLFGFVSHLQPLTDALSPYLSGNEASGTISATPPQTPPLWDGNLDIAALTSAYRNGLSPVTVVDAIFKAIEAYKEIDPAVWIYLIPKETVLAAAKELIVKFPDKTKLPPLYGVPFSVKDSIDISGIPTTTACPPLAYIPTKSAAVYERVIEQGALLFGKTNLDQLATGLTGCRSPYGIPRSVYNKDYISGGSSSGNAVGVGASLVSFSLATDTAGSGRVPAAFNGVVGYKPTRGTVSFQGVTPACLSLDCCSFVARNVEDARKVWEVCEGYDANDRYAKSTPPNLRHVDSIGPKSREFNFGIPPPEALAVCAPVYRTMFNDAVKTLQSIGGNLVHVDWAPFENAGKLLYDGTFVSERLASLPDGWLESNKDHLHPVIRELFERVVNRNSTAVQAYRDLQAKAL
jgi:allophanate hydrolase